MSNLYNPLPGIVDKPTLEQTRWVTECLVKGWLAGCSARGCIEQVMGYDIPGESVSFQDVGFMGFWNALEEAPPATTDYTHKPGKIATIHYNNPFGTPEKHRMTCSETETEAEVAAEWERRHPNYKNIRVVFDKEAEKK